MRSLCRRLLYRTTGCAVLCTCLLTTGCFSGLGGGWSNEDLADDRDFQEEVVKSGFPKASSVGLGDARQSK